MVGCFSYPTFYHLSVHCPSKTEQGGLFPGDGRGQSAPIRGQKCWQASGSHQPPWPSCLDRTWPRPRRQPRARAGSGWRFPAARCQASQRPSPACGSGGRSRQLRLHSAVEQGRWSCSWWSDPPLTSDGPHERNDGPRPVERQREQTKLFKERGIGDHVTKEESTMRYSRQQHPWYC